MKQKLELLENIFTHTDSYYKIHQILWYAEKIKNATKKSKKDTVKILREHYDKEPAIVKVGILDAQYSLTKDQKTKDEALAFLEPKDAGEEIYMMARHLVNRLEEDDEDRLQGEVSPQVSKEVFTESEDDFKVRMEAVFDPSGQDMTIIIHGTWAREGTWWRSGGDFFEYLKNELAIQDLYKGEEPFEWSGHNRDSARKEARRILVEWVLRHKIKKLNIFAHSHGANVAMLATRLGLIINKLIMLSPPVREDYYAHWEKVQEAYNIQAWFDPVVAIARGGQWFNIEQVKEKQLDASGHSTSHDPETWRNENLREFVGL